LGDGATFQDLEKKMKEHEKKITKLRNENQQLKGDFDKAIKCLERETGEIVNLDELAKDNTQWKGRAQTIEVLKSQVKRLKLELQGGDTLSTISELTGMGGALPSISMATKSHAEKNLNKLELNRAKDLEKALKELEELREELVSVKTKHKAAVARRDTLENQLKEYKSEVQSKMKILIEKTGRYIRV
jgi:DNA repair exonuclease SbcCD ATPase subunit